MTHLIEVPRARCAVVHRPQRDLEPWTIHTVSMLQSIQSGMHINVSPYSLNWVAPDGVHFEIVVDDEQELQFHGTPFDVTPVPGILKHEQAQILYHGVDELALYTQNPAIITTGRRQDQNSGYHAFIV